MVGSIKTGSLESALPYYLLPVFLITFAICAVLSEGSFGGPDSIEHYRFSRYAFRNPEFFLDPWAKPLFTIVTAPFAQLGYIGVRILNVLLGLGAGLLTFLTARQLGCKHSALALFLLLFAPIYAPLMISGMTEIMFSFLLILGIHLFFKRQCSWSAAVASLLPFVRTEGFIILPLFLLALLLGRQWKVIPLLLAGFIFFSVVGSFHYHDILWVINTMPYTGAKSDIYGSGEILHFVRNCRQIFGLPLFTLILMGALCLPFQLRDSIKTWNRSLLYQLLIGFAPFFVYFAAHSYVWWRGVGDSLGEIRVMAAVLPSAVLLALFGWSGFLRLLRLSKTAKTALAAILALSTVFPAVKSHHIPVELSPERQLLKRAVGWLETSEYAESRMVYFDPHWWFFMGHDPTDEERMRGWEGDASRLETRIQSGEVVLWDAHFGPNEGRLPLARLQENPCFELIRTFRPDAPFQTLGGHDYEIHIFVRSEVCQ